MRPDGLTLVPWAVGKQLLWDVTVEDSLAPCRINAGSVCNPGFKQPNFLLKRKSKKLTSINILSLKSFSTASFRNSGRGRPQHRNFFEQAL